MGDRVRKPLFWFPGVSSAGGQMLGINIALNASKIISGIRSENTSEMISGIRSENAQKLYQKMYQNVYLETISESQSETILPSTSINLPKTTSYLPLYHSPPSPSITISSKYPHAPSTQSASLITRSSPAAWSMIRLFSNRFSRIFFKAPGR